MASHPLHVEIEAPDLDEAVSRALAQLDCGRAEVELEILQLQSRGFLGLLGCRPARVKLSLSDRGVIARQLLRRLLELSGFSAQVEVSPSSQQIELLLSSEQSSLLIGRHGQTLEALQSLVTTMTDRLTTDRTPLCLDIDGYRQRRQLFLQQLARRLFRQVRRSRRSAATPPLSSGERRIVYELARQEADIEAFSQTQNGDFKVVVLQPRG